MAFSNVISCCTCLQSPTGEREEYYPLDADPLFSNANLKEQLMCSVPEFAEVLDENKKLWMCRDCCQGLFWGYIFRKRCLDLKNKADFGIKEDEIGTKDIDLSEPPPPQHLVARDYEKPEEDGCRYSIAEIIEQESTVNAKLLNDNEITQLQKCKSGSKPCLYNAATKSIPVPKAEKRKCDSSGVDLITSKFQELTLREKQPSLSQELNQNQSMPLLFSSTQIATNTNPHIIEPLRTAILNFKENYSANFDLCENNPHEKFGIAVKPSFPTCNKVTIPENLRFVNEDDLSKSMNVYMSSIIKKFYSKAIYLPSVAVQSNVESEIENSDHTYSLLSRKSGGNCMECGWITSNSELFDLHINTYHSEWWLTAVSHVETEMRPDVFEVCSLPEKEKQAHNNKVLELPNEDRVESKRKPTRKDTNKYNTRGRSKSSLSTIYPKKLEVSSEERKVLEKLPDKHYLTKKKQICNKTLEQKRPIKKETTKKRRKGRNKSLSRLSTKKHEVSLEKEKVPEKLQEDIQKACGNSKNFIRDKTVEHKTSTKEETNKYNTRAHSKSLSRLSNKMLEASLEEEKVPEKLQEERQKACSNSKNFIRDKTVEHKTPTKEEANKYNTRARSKSLSRFSTKKLEASLEEERVSEKLQEERQKHCVSGKNFMCDMTVKTKTSTKEQTNKYNTRARSKSLSRLSTLYPKKLEVSLEEGKLQEEKIKDCANQKDLMCDNTLEQKKTTKKETTKRNRKRGRKSASRLSTPHFDTLEVRLEERKVPEKLQEERHKECVNSKNLMRDKRVQQETAAKQEASKYKTRGRSKSLSRLSALRSKKDNSMKFDLEVNLSKEPKDNCLQEHEESSATRATPKKTDQDISSLVLSRKAEYGEVESIESEDLDSLVLRLEEDESFDINKNEWMDIPLSYDTDVIVVESLSSDERRSHHCNFDLRPDNVEHFDNYHIENKIHQDNPSNTSTIYCEAFNSLRNHGIDAETVDCPQCKVRFNADYYNRAHKLVCQKTVRNFQDTKIIYTDLKVLKLGDEHKNEKSVKNQMRELQQKINEILEKVVDLKTYRCKKCEMCFDSREVLKMHCLFKHGS